MIDINTAISEEALLGKSRAYIAKALRRKGEQDLEEYQLWASLALELLGKAALAHRHPCLVVDPRVRSRVRMPLAARSSANRRIDFVSR